MELSRFKVNSPDVVADIIDGEAVIMNLKSGRYFSTSGSGCLFWEALAAGATTNELVAAAAGRYDAEEATLRSAVHAFLDSLLEHALVVTRNGEPSEFAGVPSAADRASFNAPSLAVYSDMQDLLLLDPIHDVDQAGWPMPRPDQDSGN